MSKIIQFNEFKDNKPEKSLSEYKNVTIKQGSSKLYCDFRYNGRRIMKTSGLNDNPENRERLQSWVNDQKRKIAECSFVFAKAFPGASDDEKAFHAQFEGWEYVKDPKHVLFGDYVKKWRVEILEKDTSKSKIVDYESIIDSRLLPYFEKISFYKINGVEIKKFIQTLKHTKGPKKDTPLSASRIRNIIIPLRSIWNDACEEHRWELADPFKYLKRKIPNRKKELPEIFRFDDFMTLLENMIPIYRLITEFMIMTGMIFSEIAGLKYSHITSDNIIVCNSIVRKKKSDLSDVWYQEKDTLKTEYRNRGIRITDAMRRLLKDVKELSLSDEYVFSMKTGGRFNGDTYRKNAWTTALKRSGLKYRKPYSLRHTFAAWAFTIGMDINKLEELMGHGSKEMLFNVYGKYVKDLEQDSGKILEYLGNDFL